MKMHVTPDGPWPPLWVPVIPIEGTPLCIHKGLETGETGYCVSHLKLGERLGSALWSDAIKCYYDAQHWYRALPPEVHKIWEATPVVRDRCIESTNRATNREQRRALLEMSKSVEEKCPAPPSAAKGA